MKDPKKESPDKQPTLLKQRVSQRNENEAEAKLALQAQELRALNAMGQLVTETLDIEMVFDRVLTSVRPLLGAEGIFILLLEGDELVFAATDRVAGDGLRGLRIPVTSTYPGEVINTGRPLQLSGEAVHRRITPQLEVVLGHPIQALLAAPLRLHGELKGVMEAVHSDPDIFQADDLELLESAASWVAIAMQNAQLFTQVQTSRQRLSRLARKVVTAQEEERMRVSRELHDEAGQALIALKLNLESIRPTLPPELKVAHERLAEAIELTDETMDHIRLLAHDLRPQALDSLGLSSTLEGLCDDFSRRTQLNVQFAGEEVSLLPDPVAISFYRFLQEALTNVAKHANATKVQVELGRSKEAIFLSVSDDGEGFSGSDHSPSAGKTGGIGLIGMQERFELLGGWVKVEFRRARGTRVTAYVPVKLQREEEDR